jgi:hypothetical protein
VGGITAAATTALTSGSNFGDILKAGAVGFAAGAAAGVVASDFNSAIGGAASNAFGSGVGGFMGAVSGGAAGGYAAGVTAAELYGSSFSEANSIGLKGAAIGAAAGGAGKILEGVYKLYTNETPDPKPGVGIPRKGLYGSPVKGMNNSGMQGWELGKNNPGFLDEGGFISRIVNATPGGAATSIFHDFMQI